MQDLPAILQSQRDFFSTHKTKEPDFRIEQLKQLKKAILAYENQLYEAFWQDLHKSKFEAYETEIGLVLEEISNHIHHLHKWARPEKVPTNQLLHFWSSSRIYKEPFGLVLIMAPWNYPFNLLVNPLVGAISAGNCVTVKPSSFTPNVANVIGKMIAGYFRPDYIYCFTAGPGTGRELLTQSWDYIFFTGSQSVGRMVMQAAAQNLTPVSLELGGKSPCIVDADANLKTAASRIVWGKFLNAGQTCIAPDYLFVHSSVKVELLNLMSKKITQYFGSDPKQSRDFPRIVSEQKTQRLTGFLGKGKVVAGGTADIRERYISPTILDQVSPEDPVMTEEIFGPVLPVLEFTDIHTVLEYINAHPKPLAVYYFSEDPIHQAEVLNKTSSGGGCINDVITHIANSRMPFGGVGNSGMGGYHGKFSFDTFSHYRSVMKKSTWLDIPFRYAPYKGKFRILKMLLK
jgi:aldehyde dehydrogenase (NAD+)